MCSNYAVSKHFYVDILGLKVFAEHYREARDSFKLDLELPDGSQIELFSFPNPPERVNAPEARGLRHLAFAVDSVTQVASYLESRGIEVEPIRVDECTGKQYTFFKDPDGLPLELYQAGGIGL
ncbi:VOC family protein [Photobacterium sanctipauli]|uniref:SMU1112c/YaeR family gloxylase I-like metalloprotein n=1 Tax=Photobacterium sanctipauli TaxID=1342794 RepID=UPI00055DE707|nr:VOC family protein [Photobacterium sanctipauli]